MKNTRRWNLWGTVFSLIAGTLLHFTYEWFGGKFWAAAGAVNESTWEHLKLLFFPVLFWWILEFFICGKQAGGFWAIRALAVLAGMFFIVAGFYTYSGILGENFMAADISLFVLSVLLTFFLADRYSERAAFWPPAANAAGTVILLLLCVAFIVFTWYPPKIGLFLDPSTGSYGITK